MQHTDRSNSSTHTLIQNRAVDLGVDKIEVHH